MKTVGFLGAYSIDNTGDQLLGYAVRQAIRARVPSSREILLAPAFRGDLWQHAWDRERGIDREVRRIPADSSTAWAKGLDALVVGGGGILRLDPEFRPFLLGDASDWSPDIPAAWNAVGGENAPSFLADQGPAYRAIKRCCETLAYVSVRNETTLRLVRRCGFAGPVPVVPDPTLLMTLPDATRGHGDAILERAGVDRRKFVVGLSVGTSVRDGRAARFYKELFAALAARGPDTEVVVFPFGNVYGDAELQRLAKDGLPRARLVTEAISAVDRWRLIGALDLHVCTRYHAMLAAYAQDVPFVVMDEYLSDAGGTSKIRDFVVSHDLDGFYLAPLLSTRPAQKLANAYALLEQPGFSFEESLAAERAALESHYDAMAAALRLA